jgi:signal peptidase I
MDDQQERIDKETEKGLKTELEKDQDTELLNNQEEDDKTGWRTNLKEALDWVIHIVAAIVIAMLIVKFVAQVTVVVGTSMMPTLQDGNRLMMDKLTFRFREFERGDIIVVEAEEELRNSGHEGAQSPLIKRVIGVAGDRVRVEDGLVYVNDEAIQEDYIYGDTTYGDYPEVLVPENNIYVMGDNRTRGGSIDSRILGTFDDNKVIGRVVFRLFPLNQLGGLRR